ncbi:hypothetical protein DRP07_03280 [Archaeoglobales archaeon]|nr:MAG: hypothetical protein DRP07_03280 [Archaeoglobales archaeon]
MVENEKQRKFPGKEVPENSDELMIQVASSQLRADYRKSLGKEHARRSWDFEVKKNMESKKDKEENNSRK